MLAAPGVLEGSAALHPEPRALDNSDDVVHALPDAGLVVILCHLRGQTALLGVAPHGLYNEQTPRLQDAPHLAEQVIPTEGVIQAVAEHDVHRARRELQRVE